MCESAEIAGLRTANTCKPERKRGRVVSEMPIYDSKDYFVEGTSWRYKYIRMIIVICESSEKRTEMFQFECHLMLERTAFINIHTFQASQT